MEGCILGLGNKNNPRNSWVGLGVEGFRAYWVAVKELKLNYCNMGIYGLGLL